MQDRREQEVERLRGALSRIAESGPSTRNPTVQINGEDYGPAEYAEMVLYGIEPEVPSDG